MYNHRVISSKVLALTDIYVFNCNYRHKVCTTSEHQITISGYLQRFSINIMWDSKKNPNAIRIPSSINFEELLLELTSLLCAI